ncbi:hypothetical protein O181_032697 [Austropuccinia psidii MF-1]|uniref:Integrase catalytic domain-containing protein n=1 Tax=Austropuccinia psidii MF-1 TaxID=1389203 RepID=A0A9Q3CZY7_9BASI|nr:hypothetical protein [Austropuccinia psidii MF-1]
MDTALLLWSRVISHTGLFKNIISDTDLKFTSALWTNLHRLFGTKLAFSKAYNPQTDELAEIMIQTLENMITRFCAYGSNSWSVKKMMESKTPNRNTEERLALHPSYSSSFNIMLYKVKNYSKQSMDDAFDYAKQNWYKSHKELLVLVALHGTNAVQVEFSGELENNHPTFPVSLIKPYQPADKELFPLANPTHLTVPPVEQSEDKKIKKLIKERRLKGKNQREYLVRYRNPVHEDEWLAESEISDSDKLFRIFRHERIPQAWICL